MPKNQFQRPLPIKHAGNVPRHGKNKPPLPKAAPELGKSPPASTHSLEDLLAYRHPKSN